MEYKKSATLLQRNLDVKQQVLVNYLVPNLLTSFLYIFHFAADFCLVLQHNRDENFFYASITLFLIYLPVVGSVFLTFSDVRLWPAAGFGCKNFKWLATKLGQHLLFPVWAMYRFAEQLFWSIEAVRCEEENEIEDLLNKANRNSVFELYHFLQAYFQAAPQILFQMYIIFRQKSNFQKATVDMQVFSIILSLTKMALTTTNYQRFKSQKLAGKKYPWDKTQNLPLEKYALINPSLNLPQTLPKTTQPEEFTQQTFSHKKSAQEEEEEQETENSEPEAEREYNATFFVPVSRKNSGLSVSSSEFNFRNSRFNQSVTFNEKNEEPDAKTARCSEDEGMKENGKNAQKESGKSAENTNSGQEIERVTENEEERGRAGDVLIPKKVLFSKGRPEDDAAGKLVSFLWWFSFLLPRMLALSAFAFFFPMEIWWIISAHYVLVLAFLLYDATLEDISYYRSLFLFFIAYVYMFCLIEFKVRFKKVRFIYNGFVCLVFFENFVMCCIWYFTVEAINEWWLNYIFYLVLGSSVLSVMSMLFYIFILKPKKIVVNKEYRNSKLL